jgi:hypothetical protein
MPLIKLREDSKGRSYSSRQVFRSCIRASNRLLPVTLPLAIISLGVRAFAKLSQKWSVLTDMFLLFPFIGILGGLLSMVAFRYLPNVWELRDDRIKISGRQFRNIPWSRVEKWSLDPLDGLPGYYFLEIQLRDSRSSGSVIVMPPTAESGLVKALLESRVSAG